MVEGKDDKFSVINLMSAYIEWPEKREDAPVDIECAESKDAMLAEGYLAAFWKGPGMRALGVMLDADDDAAGCYQRIHQLFSALVPRIPRILPTEGLIVEGDEDVRLGVWVMPNNESPGDLETFLRLLIPNDAEPVWLHAVESAERAKELGAPYRDVQRAKANMHTWLAWQDPPGRPFGTALTASILDPLSPTAEPFVRWFRELYNL